MEGGLSGGEDGENGNGAQLSLQMGYGPMMVPVAYGQQQLLMQQSAVPGVAAVSPLLAGANVPSPTLVPINPLLLQPQSPIPPPITAAVPPNQQSSQSQPASPASARRDAIRIQLEYYFSFENLVRDYYLRSLMDERGYVSLQTMRSFNKLRQMTGGDIEELVQAAVTSPLLKVKKGSVKLRKEWSKWIPPPSENEERNEESSEDESLGYDQLPQQQQQHQSEADQQPQQPLTPNGQMPNHATMEENKAGEIAMPPPQMPPPGQYYHLNMAPQPLYNNYYMPPAVAATAYYPPYAHLPYPYNQQQMLMMQHFQQQQHAAAQQQAQQQQHQHPADSYQHMQQQQTHMGPPQGDFKRRLFNHPPGRGGGGGRGGGQMRGQRRGGQFTGIPSPRQDVSPSAVNGPPQPSPPTS